MDSPVKIAVIGAGSVGFTRKLLRDILAVPEFADTEFRFMDISPENLEMSSNLCTKIIADSNLPATVVPTSSQREAIKGADYVLCVVRVGGLTAFAHDVDVREAACHRPQEERLAPHRLRQNDRPVRAHQPQDQAREPTAGSDVEQSQVGSPTLVSQRHISCLLTHLSFLLFHVLLFLSAARRDYLCHMSSLP